MRAGRVAEALEAAGVETTVVEGGVPFPGFARRVSARIPLPPVRVAAENMRLLLHPDGVPFSEADMEARRDMLLGVFRQTRPDILLIEAFPFGRRQMRFELLPLLNEASAARTPVIASSIRDILQERGKPERMRETTDTLRQWFNLVLVHGDSVTTPLEATFPLAGEIIDLVHYTGIVGPASPPAPIAGHELVISTGGGATGYPVLAAALAALPRTSFRDRPVVAVAGPQMTEADFATLSRNPPANVRLLRFAPDLPGLFAGARLSVSRAGYNTVAEIMAAGCRSVLCPFVGDGQTEQMIRAQALERADRCVMIGEDQLSPERMAAAIERALALPAPVPEPSHGALRAAETLIGLL
jgi:predicted glycosyltransferase